MAVHAWYRPNFERRRPTGISSATVHRSIAVVRRSPRLGLEHFVLILWSKTVAPSGKLVKPNTGNRAQYVGADKERVKGVFPIPVESCFCGWRRRNSGGEARSADKAKTIWSFCLLLCKRKSDGTEYSQDDTSRNNYSADRGPAPKYDVLCYLPVGGKLQLVAAIRKGRVCRPARTISQFGYGSGSLAAWPHCVIHTVVWSCDRVIKGHHSSPRDSGGALDPLN